MNRPRVIFFVIAAVLSGAAGVALVSVLAQRGPSPTPADPATQVQGEGRFQPIPSTYATGATDPPLVPASEARIPKDDRVIGFVENGQAVAIRKSSMDSYRGHILRFTEKVHSMNLAVVHCNRSNCTRIVRSPSSDLRVAGYQHGIDEMILEVDGKRQSLSEFGSPEFVETTWGEWLKSHPASLVMDLDAHNLNRHFEKRRQAKTNE